MSINKRWTVMLAACGGAALALALSSRRKHRRRAEKKAHKADLHEWENEGGNLAPSDDIGTGGRPGVNA